MTKLPHARALARVAALSLAAIGTVAAAQDVTINAMTDTITRSVAVSTAGLDLGTTHGRNTLDRRLRMAVNSVCEGWDISPIRDAHEFTRCSTAALSDARAQAAQRLATNDMRPIRVSRS